MAENKSLILLNAELVTQSKQAPYGTPLARNEKIAASVPIPLLDLAVQVHNNVPSWVEQEFRELPNFWAMKLDCSLLGSNTTFPRNQIR